MTPDILANAAVSGILLGGFYAVASLGLTITFGLLEIPNVAHPTFMVLAAYCVALLSARGLDPVLSALAVAPVFYALGAALYGAYHVAFERGGATSTLQSFTFFFGVALVVQVSMTLVFGVDLLSVEAAYIGRSLTLGPLTMPFRLMVPFGLGIATGVAMWLYLARTRTGLAIRAVAHDAQALRIVGRSPLAAKRHAFGLAMATAALAGGALVVVTPVDPFSGTQYIGRTFAIVVLAGMGSVPGTIVAALLIGLLESLVVTFIGATWAPGVAFTALLGTLALRPGGIFGIAR